MKFELFDVSTAKYIFFQLGTNSLRYQLRDNSGNFKE